MRAFDRGYFGEVFTVSPREEQFVLKRLIKSPVVSSANQLASEVTLFHALAPHKNIIGYHGSFLKDGSWFVALEKGGRSIVDLICKNSRPRKIKKLSI